MINPRISVVWSTNKHSLALHVYKKYIPKLRLYTLPLVSEPFSCTPRVQEVHTKADGCTPYPWSPWLRGIIQLSRIGNVLRHI